jgi:hypothetical protein
MEVRFNSIVCRVFILGLFFVSCKSNEQKLNSFNLCSEFYELNKELNFNGLFNVQILGIRESSEFNAISTLTH